MKFESYWTPENYKFLKDRNDCYVILAPRTILGEKMWMFDSYQLPEIFNLYRRLYSKLLYPNLDEGKSHVDKFLIKLCNLESFI